MAIAADKLRELIRKEVNKNIEKLDHDVDCICEDLRKGKSSGVNIAKTKKYGDFDHPLYKDVVRLFLKK